MTSEYALTQENIMTYRDSDAVKVQHRIVLKLCLELYKHRWSSKIIAKL